MISERKKSKKTVSMNGVEFCKQFNVWCVASIRIKKMKRKVHQSLFCSEETAMEYWKSLVVSFENDHREEIELQKERCKMNMYENITSVSKTYIFNGEECNKQIFKFWKSSVLELAESADLDECTNSIDVSWHDDCEANPDEMLLAS